MRYVAGAFIVIAAAFVITGVAAAVMLTADTAGDQARAVIKTFSGAEIGTATLTQMRNGVLVRVNLTKATPGGHAFHIHEIGRCEPPFESAGGHFTPAGTRHGFADPAGQHADDLPNIEVPKGGALTFELLVNGVSLSKGPSSLQDDNGSALVMHAGTDDYRTDPARGAGDRIACGVVTQ